MNRIEKILLVTALTLLVACAQLGLTKPLTFNEKLATGYGAITAVLDTSATLYQDKRISKDDLANIEKQADNVKVALDLADAYEHTDPPTGNNKLAAALQALQALQTYVAKQQSGGAK